MNCITSFLSYLQFEKGYSDKTVDAYKRDLHQFASYVEQEENEDFLLQVDTDDVRWWIAELMKNGYVSTSVNRKLSSLRAFYKYLFGQGLIDKDPMRKVVGPKNKKTLPSFLKESEMEDLLDEANFNSDFEGVRDRLILDMLYVTGIRSSELIELDNSDVDVKQHTIKVLGKRNKERLIPFDQRLGGEIKKYTEVRDKEVESKGDAFFVRKNGERLYRRLLYQIVNIHLSKYSTLEQKSPHVLRHTFATAMLNHGAELGAVKELLGHQSVSTTAIYTHTTFEELKKVYKQAHPRA